MTDHPDAFTLDQFVEEQLLGSEQAQVAAHIAGCAACRGTTGQMARWKTALLQLPREASPPSLAGRIMTAVASQRRLERGLRAILAGAMASATLGGVLILSATADLQNMLTTALDSSAPPGWDVSLGEFLEAPIEASMTVLGGAVTWSTALTDGVGVAVLLGTALLGLAAFGGLARLLRSPEQKPPALR